MALMKLSSPAKLNLVLKIVGRRPDGFHELKTVFERISLSDTLTFRPLKQGIRITCDHRSVPRDSRNLAYKAARLLQEKESVKRGVWIDIKKRIPVAAGLAGGSSNAATTLQGLNRLWDLRLPQRKLIAYAKLLGSDVAFFLHDCSFALGTGRGDRIKVLDIKGKFWHVLITPTSPLLTRDVYGAYAAHFSRRRSPAGKRLPVRLTKSIDNVSMLSRSLKKSDIAGVQRSLQNDLEGPIGKLRPELLKLKDKLEDLQPQGVCFSGSGPSIFVLTRDRAEAEIIAHRFRRRYSQVFVVATA
jgi:4-diphosphocytidyl-2-C-methyl-D-erythritol kinase